MGLHFLIRNQIKLKINCSLDLIMSSTTRNTITPSHMKIVSWQRIRCVTGWS